VGEDWARLTVGLDGLVKRLIFALSGNELWSSMPLSCPISVPQSSWNSFLHVWGNSYSLTIPCINDK